MSPPTHWQHRIQQAAPTGVGSALWHVAAITPFSCTCRLCFDRVSKFENIVWHELRSNFQKMLHCMSISHLEEDLVETYVGAGMVPRRPLELVIDWQLQFCTHCICIHILPPSRKYLTRAAVCRQPRQHCCAARASGTSVLRTTIVNSIHCLIGSADILLERVQNRTTWYCHDGTAEHVTALLSW